jgi:hypothetical protein
MCRIFATLAISLLVAGTGATTEISGSLRGSGSLKPAHLKSRHVKRDHIGTVYHEAVYQGTISNGAVAYATASDGSASDGSARKLSTVGCVGCAGSNRLKSPFVKKSFVKGTEGDEGDEGNEGNEGFRFFKIGNEGDEGDEGDEGNEGNEGDEGDEGNEGDEGDEGDEGNEGQGGALFQHVLAPPFTLFPKKPNYRHSTTCFVVYFHRASLCRKKKRKTCFFRHFSALPGF